MRTIMFLHLGPKLSGERQLKTLVSSLAARLAVNPTINYKKHYNKKSFLNNKKGNTQHIYIDSQNRIPLTTTAPTVPVCDKENSYDIS